MAGGPLEPRPTIPLEREFEGWITERIREYFEAIEIKVHIWAVSPTDEATWPADEVAWLNGKVFGLQFKRAELGAKLAKSSGKFERLHWCLDDVPGQFDLVKKSPEIFYALPTFVNQDWRKVSLHQFILWHPGRCRATSTIWYNTTTAKKPRWRACIERRPNSYRWGNFVERLMRCEVGVPVGGVSSAKYRDRLADQLGTMLPKERVKANDDGDGDGTHEEAPLILVNVELPG